MLVSLASSTQTCFSRAVCAYVSASRATNPAAPWTMKSHSLLPLNGDISSSKSLNNVQTWLETCDEDHSCISYNTYTMPKRILQIAQDSIFLREDLDGQFRYACLSHCWGAGRLSFKLVKSHRLDLCHGFSVNDLPKTCQDAVSICDWLGVEYLWIDGLCKDTLNTVCLLTDSARHRSR